MVLLKVYTLLVTVLLAVVDRSRIPLAEVGIPVKEITAVRVAAAELAALVPMLRVGGVLVVLEILPLLITLLVPEGLVFQATFLGHRLFMAVAAAAALAMNSTPGSVALAALVVVAPDSLRTVVAEAGVAVMEPTD